MPNIHIINEGQPESDWFTPEPPPVSDDWPPSGDTAGKPDLHSLFDAPDLASFVKAPKTATAKEYEQRVRALLKAGIIGAINNKDLPDAATLIYHGPSFAAAAGYLADADDRAKHTIDMLTTPGNPYALFIMATLPMISQLFRNHERQLRTAPEVFRSRKQRKAARKAENANQPKVEIKLPFGRSIKLGLRARFPIGRIFANMRGQTQDPDELTYRVFSDPKVVSELRKQGVPIYTVPRNNG